MLPSQHPAGRRLPGARAVAIGILSCSLLLLPLHLGLQFVPMPDWMRFTISGGSVAAAMVIIILLTTGAIGPRRRVWWAAMRRCGHDVCVICGYWLEHRAPGSHACPECGTPDDRQPLPLGERRDGGRWPRFEVEAPPEPGTRDDGDRP